MSDEKTEGRPYMGMGVFQPDGDAAPGTTIVGGQPDGQRRKGVVSVPVGLEQLLYTAARDADFRAELLRDRERAAARLRIALTDSERSALVIAPQVQLEAMIDRIDTSEQNLKRRGFMRAVAATVVTLAAGSGLTACGGSDGAAGSESGAPFKGDAQQVQVQAPEPLPPTGIRPDDIPEPVPPMAGALAQPPDASVSPTVDLEAEQPRPTKGIRPDEPEEPAPAAKPPQKPKVDVKPPQMPTRGHTGF
jgi:hypothetical protein